MPPRVPSRLPRLAAYGPAAACIFVIGICLLALVGWALNLERLKTLMRPGHQGMNPLTALCLILCAISLWLQRRPDDQSEKPQRRSERRRFIAMLLPTIVLFVGATRLIGYAAGWER